MSVTNGRPFSGRTHSPCWPVSGLTERPSSPSQVLVQGSQWRMMKAEWASKNFSAGHSSVLPLRGQRRLGGVALTDQMTDRCSVDALLLPVELQRVNHTASTNSRDSTRQNAAHSTIQTAMSNHNPIDPLAVLPPPALPDPVIERVIERVERLLLRYAELQRTNALLNEQVNVLAHERDSLKSRLSAARSRVDALLERLPENAVATLQTSAGADS